MRRIRTIFAAVARNHIRAYWSRIIRAHCLRQWRLFGPAPPDVLDPPGQTMLRCDYAAKLRPLTLEARMFRDEQGQLKNGIQKCSYSHEAMIDLIVANPAVSQNELAAYFGVSASWISLIISSDAFQAKLGEKREAIIDPVLRGAVEESFKGLIMRSISIVRDKLNGDVPLDAALEVLRVSSKALGYGARPSTSVTVNGNANLIGVLSSLQPPAPKSKPEPRTIDVTPEKPKFVPPSGADKLLESFAAA